MAFDVAYVFSKMGQFGLLHFFKSHCSFRASYEEKIFVHKAFAINLDLCGHRNWFALATGTY